jgi:hypothetical protein
MNVVKDSFCIHILKNKSLSNQYKTIWTNKYLYNFKRDNDTILNLFKDDPTKKLVDLDKVDKYIIKS